MSDMNNSVCCMITKAVVYQSVIHFSDIQEGSEQVKEENKNLDIVNCESRIQTIGSNIDIGVTQGWNKSEGGSGLLYKLSRGDLEYSLFINTRSHNGC